MTAVLFNCVAGGFLAGAVDISPAIGAISMNGIAAVAGLFAPVTDGVLRAGVLKEIWTGELIKRSAPVLKALGSMAFLICHPLSRTTLFTSLT